MIKTVFSPSVEGELYCYICTTLYQKPTFMSKASFHFEIHLNVNILSSKSLVLCVPNVVTL